MSSQPRIAEPASRDLMTTAQVAAELQVAEKTLANQRSRREGPPYVRVSGGAIRYSRAALTAWLKGRQVNHDSTGSMQTVAIR